MSKYASLETVKHLTALNHLNKVNILTGIRPTCTVKRSEPKIIVGSRGKAPKTPAILG